MFLALDLQQAAARVRDGVRHPGNLWSLVASYDDIAGGVDHEPRRLGDGLCIDGGYGGARLEARDGAASFLRAHGRARGHTHTHTHTHTAVMPARCPSGGRGEAGRCHLPGLHTR